MEVKTGIFETLETRFSGQNLMRRVFIFVLKFKTNFLKKILPKKYIKRSRTIQLEVQNNFWTFLFKTVQKYIIKVSQAHITYHNTTYLYKINSLGPLDNENVVSKKIKSRKQQGKQQIKITKSLCKMKVKFWVKVEDSRTATWTAVVIFQHCYPKMVLFFNFFKMASWKGSTSP